MDLTHFEVVLTLQVPVPNMYEAIRAAAHVLAHILVSCRQCGDWNIAYVFSQCLKLLLIPYQLYGLDDVIQDGRGNLGENSQYFWC